MAIGEFVRTTGRPDGARDIPITCVVAGWQYAPLPRDAGIDVSRAVSATCTSSTGDPAAGPGRGAYRLVEMRRLSPDGTLVLSATPSRATASWAPDGHTRRLHRGSPAPRREHLEPSARVFVADASTRVASRSRQPRRTDERSLVRPDGARIRTIVSEGGGPAGTSGSSDPTGLTHDASCRSRAARAAACGRRTPPISSRRGPTVRGMASSSSRLTAAGIRA